MRRLLCFIFLCLAPTIAKAEFPHWQKDQIVQLIEWLDAAKDDGLGPAASEAFTVRDALQTPDTPRLDSGATAAAVSLLRAHRNGCCNASLRTGWHIDNGIALTDPLVAVTDAVRLNRLGELFGTARRDALGFATTLLSTDPAWNGKRVDEAVATGRTVKVDMLQPIPVYVAYFTAEPDGNGGIRYFPDIYKRDKGATTSDGSERCTQ